METLSFSGPFSWFGAIDAQPIYDSSQGAQPGIYLWTVPLSEGYLVYYVGETGKSFRQRLSQHYQEYIQARYHLYAPDQFAKGEKLCLWPGRYDRNDIKTDQECEAKRHDLAPATQAMTQLLRFSLTPLVCNQRIRRRLEAAIALKLYASQGLAGTFQDQGIRYEPKLKSEEPITCLIESSSVLIGLTTKANGPKCSGVVAEPA